MLLQLAQWRVGLLAQWRVGLHGPNSPLGELGYVCSTRTMASWAERTNSPLGELDELSLTRPMASWVDHCNIPYGESDDARLVVSMLGNRLFERLNDPFRGAYRVLLLKYKVLVFCTFIFYFRKVSREFSDIDSCCC